MTTKLESKKTADSLIQWIREYAALHIDSHLADERRSFPPHVFFDIGNQGFFGIHITQKYGGLELHTFDMLRVIEQVAAIDLTLAVIIIESVQGAHTLEKYASDSMKDKYLNLLAAGRIFTAGAMTESAAGSNPRAMKSVATPDNENGWVINGSKRWVGMGASASITAVYVQEYDSNHHWLGMSGFLVPQSTEGLHIGHDYATMGIRGFSKNELSMDNIRVTSEHLLGKPGEGMEIAQDNMMYIRLCLAAATVGAMKRSVQLMHRYAGRRIVATGTLLENPVTLARLSEITAVIDAIDNFIYLVSSNFDKNQLSVPEEAFVVSKILGSEYLGWVADLAVQILGARGYEEACDVSKIFRDARVFRIFEGPTEALNMYIGSRILAKNQILEDFICNTLNQKKLFDEIISNVEKVNENCLSHKSHLFVNPFSVNYWSQALCGEIITYGLLLAGIQHSIETNETSNLQRAVIWARNKFDEVIHKALSSSLEEKLLTHSGELQEIVSSYADTIGNVDQLRNGSNLAIDELLQCNQENTVNNSIVHHEHEEVSGIGKLLSSTESSRLLHNWNNVEKNTLYSSIFVHRLFEEQVLKNPKSIAVAFNGETISYEELNSQANRVAWYLRKEGVKDGKLVALYFMRSIEMIIGLLGIFKADGAYLPLDHNYPEKSLKFMLDDSETTIVLSQKNLSKNIDFGSQKIIFIDDIFESVPADIPLDASKNPNEDNIGYVIYTSGSSGQPKGVMLPHKALGNLINWHNEKINEKRNVLQFTTLNFDMSFIEIFSALCSGGTLKLISEQDRLDLARFSKIIQKNAIEQLVISVPFLKNLVNSGIDSERFRSLKEIIIAGEQLVITDSVKSFFKQLGSCKLLNYYGPSETHVVTGYEFPKNISDWPEYPPIGQVISNTKILILDDKKQLVPVGAKGELFIGGMCLAKGYINSDELTREKFIPDPWSDKPGDLLYQSGDCGKYMPDGTLVFLGRKDEQLKIRGYRIEPQEIEWHLVKYPGIKEAVVIAKRGITADKHLEAFIIYDGALNDDFVNELQSFLQERLPPHMLPTVFNVIERMPLTNSGKIDKLALEKHDGANIYSINRITEPGSETEKKIITIMEDLFKVPVGVNNSFISIGGNSLLAMQVISRLRKQFAVDVPAYSLLSDPTIADTAKRIDMLNSH